MRRRRAVEGTASRPPRAEGARRLPTRSVRPPAVLAALIVLGLLASAIHAAAAMDCRGATPLPPDLRVMPPGGDVPPAVAAFAGAWTGAWTGPWTDAWTGAWT